MRFFIMQVEYETEPVEDDEPIPKDKCLVVYQFRGEIPADNLGLENILAEDMRKNIGDMKNHTDFVSLVSEVTDPAMLRVLKQWNQRCIDFESCLFAEGTVD